MITDLISTLLLATPPAKTDTAETLALAIGAVLVELHLGQRKLTPGLQKTSHGQRTNHFRIISVQTSWLKQCSCSPR